MAEQHTGQDTGPGTWRVRYKPAADTGNRTAGFRHRAYAVHWAGRHAAEQPPSTAED